MGDGGLAGGAPFALRCVRGVADGWDGGRSPKPLSPKRPSPNARTMLPVRRPLRHIRTFLPPALAVLVGVAFVAGGVARVLERGGEPGSRVRATISAVEAMSGEVEGYLRAVEPREFRFPDDHGPHPGYRTEWWYFTGNLEDEDGRRFGYQLTFFRNEVAPPLGDPDLLGGDVSVTVEEASPDGGATARTSAWATRDVYMAHFAVTDVEGGDFHAFDRFARGAMGLAGARARPFHVWLEGWELRAVDDDRDFPSRLRASDGEVAIDLVLEAGKPPVLQGIDGLSPKGPEPGNASYYYAHTRMPTRGTIRIGEATYSVHGNSWMDREWGTSALGEDQEGWDWFSIQLSDGAEVMFWQLRTRVMGAERFAEGAVVEPDGERRYVHRDQARLEVLDHWTSPRDGTRYPARWRLQITGEDVDLEISPLLADQEMNLAVRYWEGAVRVHGTRAGRSVDGYGYVEMTGYGGEADPRRR